MMEKNISVNGCNYLLKIKRINNSYQVDLFPDGKSMHHGISTNYSNLTELKTSLREWIINVHLDVTRSVTTSFHKEFNEWDGVIEI